MAAAEPEEEVERGAEEKEEAVDEDEERKELDDKGEDDGADEEGESEEDEVRGGWEDEQERATCLQSLAAGTPVEERDAALLALREKAVWRDNWAALWRDREVRAALLVCAEPPDPDRGRNPYGDEDEAEPPEDSTRAFAVGILATLAASPENQPDMARDKGTRNVLVGSADKDRPEGLRTQALMALSGLALGGALEEAAVEPELESTPVGRCEACECDPCVCHAGDALDRTKDRDVCDALVFGAARGVAANVRLDVLGKLWTLAASERGEAAKVWGHSGLQEALVSAAAAGEPCDVRASALGALWAFAAADELREVMWGDARVREALLAGAAAEAGDAGAAPGSREQRSRSLGALACLGSARPNQEAMWADGGLAAALLKTVRAGGPLRGDAFRVLVELTKHEDNQEPMAKAGVANLLAAAAEDPALAAAERRACRFGRDRLLAGAPGFAGAPPGARAA